VLLPHHKLTDTGVQSPGIGERGLPDPVRRALSFCDGRHTLSQVAEAASAARSHLIAAQEQELILLWHRPVPPAAPEVGAVERIILSPHTLEWRTSMRSARTFQGRGEWTSLRAAISW
jgi:hypothetical protein